MVKVYKIKARVWRWPGDAGWHFVNLDRKKSEEIKRLKSKNSYGAGFLRIEASVGKTKWRTALFPYTKEGIYLVSIRKDVRKKEDVREGDMIDVSFSFIKK